LSGWVLHPKGGVPGAPCLAFEYPSPGGTGILPVQSTGWKPVPPKLTTDY